MNVFIAQAVKNVESGDIPTRNRMVKVYENIIRLSGIYGDPDVSGLNDAIIKRWSESALMYIKKKAWKAVESNHVDLTK